MKNASRPCSRNRCVMMLLAFLSIAFIAAAMPSDSAAQSKNAKPRLGAPAATETAEAPDESLTAWNIIQMTSWLFWPFVAVTAVGLMMLSLKGLQEYQEKSRANSLLSERIQPQQLRGIVQRMQDLPPNRASRLLLAMIVTFRKTKNAELLGEDAHAFLDTQRESFETFNRIMGFLSDSAGALGLLGTVWGIFETFHGGKLDGPTILQGMSISLVTTLVGLVISLGLNAGTTAIFAMFNRQLNFLTTRAEELRQCLLGVVPRQAGAARASAAQAARRHDETASYSEAPAPPHPVHEEERVYGPTTVPAYETATINGWG